LYATESYTYRYDGLLASVTDPGNDTTSHTYDFLGRRTQTTFPDLSTVSYTYDDTNNKITFTNGRGYDVISWYNWLSQLEKVEEEYATDTFAVTTYQYDEIGNLTSFTDAENHATNFICASLFGITRTTFPDSEYEEYQYDNVGNVVTFTDCKGNVTSYTFDDAYRLTQIQYQDQSTVSFTYDVNSNRTRMDDNAPSTGDYVEYTYDTWNRQTTEARHISSSTYTISYQYDTANRLTSLTYPDSMQILYSYDDLDRTTEIKRYVDGINDEILMDNVHYDTESLLTQFDYGNNLRATFAYDTRDRLSTFDLKNGETSYLDLDYTFDNNDNITQLVNGWRDTSSAWHSETESYGYDGLDRLTSGSCTSWSHTYSYDKMGNRTAKDAITYTINTVNEVTALSDGTSLVYDDNGNRTQKNKGTDTWDYTYDYENRLKKVEKNSVILEEYVYNGDGERLQITENSVTSTYIRSGLDILYEENNNGTAQYIYGPPGLLAKRTTLNQETSTYYYHTDHLGSTRLVTDSNKNIVSAMTYHPFGMSSIEEGSEDFLYNGKEKDSTGLYYYGARYYDPDIGKFITRDQQRGSINNPQSLNRYAYCVNNPLKYIDPDGHDYFKPEWGQGRDKTFSLYWTHVRSQLMQFKFFGQLCSKFYNWAQTYDCEAWIASWSLGPVGTGGGYLAAGAAGATAGGILAMAVGLLLATMYVAGKKFHAKLWNDDEFIRLWNTMEMYLNQLVEGYDCEQEFNDACCELAIYMLQKLYPDDWREHADPELLDYYDELQKRKNSSNSSSGQSRSSNSSSGTSSNNPQRMPL
jgi:RHS repeat-associated protein